MGAMTFHAKHMTVEAYRWDGENEEAIGAWGDWADVCIKTSNPPYLVVPGQRELARLSRTWFRTSSPDDYTRDIDLPEHVAMLGQLSEKAAADDARHGLVWGKQ